MHDKDRLLIEMKNRLLQLGDGNKATTSTSGKAHYKRKMKNKQRLGGDGLSLQVFANAKSSNAYNPHLIKKQKEMYKNAKIVKKFKKGLNQEREMEKILPSSSIYEGMDAVKEGNRTNAGRKKKSISLQSAREEYEKKRDEMEKAKREREAMIRAKEEERARAACKRKQLRQSMFKKTRSGQPVMKYRIEHILEGIKNEQLS